MNSVRVVQSSFSGWKVEALWPTGKGVRVTLTLTDPDGQTETDIHEWRATEEHPVEEVVDALVEFIDGLVHWRARNATGGEIRIGTASDDYSGESLLEVI
jgi:hypothetical protein